MKSLALDMGGVLLELDIRAAIDAFKTLAGFEDIENYLDPWHQRGFFSEMEEGIVSEEEFYEECLRHCRPGTTKDDIIDCYRAFIVGFLPEKVEIVNRLKEKYDLYLLSNNNPVAYYHVCGPLAEKAGMPFGKTFVKQFNSFQMKMQKPGEAIFRKAVEEIGDAPSDIIFLDDSQTNVDAAARLGIDARLYRSVEDLRSLL